MSLKGFYNAVEAFVFSHPIIVAALLSLAVFTIHYRSRIDRHLHQLQKSKLFGKRPLRVKRVDYAADNNTSSNSSEFDNQIKLVQVCPEFKQKYQKKYRLRSLGEYLATLTPEIPSDADFHKWIKVELEATLATAVLTGLGQNFGAAILPATLNAATTRKFIGSIAKIVADTILQSTSILKRQRNNTGGVPLSLFAATYIAELNYQYSKQVKVNKEGNDEIDEKHDNKKVVSQGKVKANGAAKHGKKTKNKKSDEHPKDTIATIDSEHDLTPTQRLERGEVGFNPSFATAMDKNNNLIVPPVFILDQHWHAAIEIMQTLVEQEREKAWKSSKLDASGENGTIADSVAKHFDPDSYDLAPPEPVNERLLPGLHFGFGGKAIQCSHTHKQILQNRLLSLLLNRLASNYNKSSNKFVVKTNKDSQINIIKSADLIKALIETGHTVETCVRSQVTTFGVGLSVKERDDSWTNIPLAFFLQSGFIDKDGNDAYTMLPHSGLDLEIRGPLLEKGSLQHYMCIDGVCAWYSNHNPVAPWIKTIDCGPIFTGENAIRSMRIAGLEAIVINNVATKMNLPFGGYALTGACNDSAALIEYAMTKKTHIYPITFGRFAMQNLRYAQVYKTEMASEFDEDDIRDLNALIDAMMQVPSDLTAMPSNAKDQIERYLHWNCSTEMPFTVMKESEKIIRELQCDL